MLKTQLNKLLKFQVLNIVSDMQCNMFTKQKYDSPKDVKLLIPQRKTIIL